MNPTNPTANARRAPTTSATFPPTIRKPPKHNVYAVITHGSPCAVNSSS